MRNHLACAAVTVAGMAMTLAAGSAAAERGDEPPAAPAPTSDPARVLDFTLNRIDGTPERLAAYKGKVILIVNVASQCGLTPQYEALEALYEARKEEGFVILAFPANNFGAQEPGTNEEIAEFCSSKFSVTFPMFAKISVKGEDQAPLYRMLSDLPAPLGGEPKWNFTKFLVDRAGRVVERIEPRTTPDDPIVTAKIDALLAANP